MQQKELDTLLKKLKASESRVRQWRKEAKMWQEAAESWMKSYQEIKDKYEPEYMSCGDDHFPIVQGEEIK